MATIRGASAQYGDMRGTAALDFHGRSGGEFRDLAQHIGATGFPVALVINPGVDVRAEEHFFSVTVHTTDVAAGADDLQQYARDHDNRIPTKCFDGRLTLKEFSRFAKRFEVVLQSRVVPDVELQYEEE